MDWYESNADRETALAFAHEFTAAQVRLKSFPGMFRLDDAIGFRRVHLDHFPYVEWYWTDEDSHRVLVLALTHNRRSDEAISDSVSRSAAAVPTPPRLPRLTTQQTAEMLSSRLDAALTETDAQDA
jgi:plasmid stabilization system protein ParE